MPEHPFAGMYAAMVTPLTPERALNVPMAQKLMLHLLSQGLDGIYVAGTTGEGVRLPFETRRHLLEALMEVLPEGKRIFVHVGTPDVRDAIMLAQHAASQKAHAISSLPPALDSEAVMAYYKELAANSPLPLLVYYYPKAAPFAFQDSQELLAICDLPNVLGVKFTDFNVYLLNQLVNRGKLVFSGYDEALVAGLLMGAQGGIGTTYNSLAPVVLELAKAARCGDWERARTLQSGVNGAMDIFFRYPFFPAVRESVRQLGFDCGPMVSGDDFESEAQRRQFLEDMNTNLPPEVVELIHWPITAKSGS